MPPRQPIKRKSLRKPLQSLTEVAQQLNLTRVTVGAQTVTPSPSSQASRRHLSLYPDLTLAIHMLEKRQLNLAQQYGAQSERAIVVSKWLNQLKILHSEMQKMHKLEQLANKLKSKLL
jgi:hypothetical protein